MRIKILQGDITTRSTDAIVNAANSSLLGGGGVDGAIHRAAGRELLEACRELRRNELPGGLDVGKPWRLRVPASCAVGDSHRGAQPACRETDPGLLASCFRESLAVASQLGVGSVAFPAISAGIYGWDARQVAEVAYDVVTALGDSVPERGGSKQRPGKSAGNSGVRAVFGADGGRLSVRF